MEYEVYVFYQRVGGETCRSEAATVTVEVTALPENSQASILYPNPASHSFTVESTVKEIKVFDALGQLVQQGTEKIVEVSTWPEGIYFVRIMDENDIVSTVKFVKR